MSSYDAIILAALFGFFLLAYVLLAPVYRFLKREEQISKQWTPEALAERMYETRSKNGKGKEHVAGDEEDGRAA